MKKVKGKLLEIDTPTPEERAWIFNALATPAVHVPLGCRAAPERALFDADQIELWRGEARRREPVRYHVLRALTHGKAVGFFLDFGWDRPTDTTREIDLAFPDPQERSAASYLDATVIVAQYLFGNGLAKRLRWRVAGAAGAPRRSARQGARLLLKQRERHPVTGEWVTQYVYEYALADFESLGETFGVDPRQDYGEQQTTFWEAYRRR